VLRSSAPDDRYAVGERRLWSGGYDSDGSLASRLVYGRTIWSLVGVTRFAPFLQSRCALA
jgi:hypothetical protein